jgi:hypothetical protein
MQRYYQHLYDSDQAMATNQFGRLDPNDRNASTNTIGSAFQNPTGNSGFASTPFNAFQENESFRSARPSVFSDIFGSDADNNNTPNPESARLKAEQKAHMDDFKELWNIDQPAAAPVSASTPTPVSSGPIFGTQSGQSFTPAGLTDNGFRRAQPTTTFQPVITPSSRIAPPPRADFAPPQRPF